MKTHRLLGGLLAWGVLLVAPGAVLAKEPAAAMVCPGKDLLPGLRNATPEAGKRVDAAARSAVNGQALLWRISKAGVADSYLFGTIHVSDPRVARLPAAATEALSRARRLVLEVADLSPAALEVAFGKVGQDLTFGDGRSLRHLLGAAELAVLEEVAKNSGLAPNFLDQARPWLVTLLFSLSDCEQKRVAAGHLVLDQQLAERAKKRAIPVLGLETLEGQMRAMASIPDADQLTILRASIKLRDKSDDVFETLIQRYLGRQITMVWPLQIELWRSVGFDPAAFASFQRELVTVRNGKMRDAALPLLAEGGAFVAVGALHLVGRDGLVALFREAGFEVVAAD